MGATTPKKKVARSEKRREALLKIMRQDVAKMREIIRKKSLVK